MTQLTPKDKALLLFIDIGKIISIDSKFKSNEDGGEQTHTFDKVIAKKLATMFVDRIMDEMYVHYGWGTEAEILNQEWKDIKKELEIL